MGLRRPMKPWGCGLRGDGGGGGGPALTLFFARGPVEEPLSVTAVPLMSLLFELDQNCSLGKCAHYPQHSVLSPCSSCIPVLVTWYNNSNTYLPGADDVSSTVLCI